MYATTILNKIRKTRNQSVIKNTALEPNPVVYYPFYFGELFTSVAIVIVMKLPKKTISFILFLFHTEIVAPFFINIVIIQKNNYTPLKETLYEKTLKQNGKSNFFATNNNHKGQNYISILWIL